MQEDELTASLAFGRECCAVSSMGMQSGLGQTTAPRPTVASVHAALPDADVDPGRQFSLPEAVARLDAAGQRRRQGAYRGRRQRPRRARASSMILSVSDHSPSPSIWWGSNQRASAASSPGTNTTVCASAAKSTKV